MLTAAPERSRAQRLDALAAANRIRSYRRQVKQDVSAGRLAAGDVLRQPIDPRLETMKLRDLLLCVRGLGVVKVDHLLHRHRASPRKTIGGLSDRQRAELIADLEGRQAGQGTR
jgi:guanylate kinase